MDNNDLNKKNSEEEKLLTFLQRTKEGEYAKVDERSLAYARMREVSEPIEPLSETFYYSVS